MVFLTRFFLCEKEDFFVTRVIEILVLRQFFIINIKDDFCWLVLVRKKWYLNMKSERMKWKIYVKMLYF